MTNLLIRLGERLADFGADEASRAVIRDAERANGWFSESDMRRAVEAIRSQMLAQERLREWLAGYDLPTVAPRCVLVVMAGNIPLVGFFDLLCVLAAGDRCLVKPSTKDRVLMEYVVGLMREIEPQLPVEFCDGAAEAEAVIATGSDNANRYFRAQYGAIPALLRGNRHSVAVLSGRETTEQLRGLADDIWAYSGLGCRSVSMIFVPEGHKLALRMPTVNPKYANNYRQTKALLMLSETPFVDLGAAVAVERCAFPLALSELSIFRYRSLDEVERWIAEHDDQLQCVVSECVEHTRRTGFGCAQSPALTDYPDERDVMAFLTTR